MINLEKELKSVNKVHAKTRKTFDPVVAAEEILNGAEKEKESVLGLFGMKDSQIKYHRERSHFMETEKINERFGNVYEESNLKVLAMRYGLRFLPLARYNGAVDSELAGKIIEFCKKHELDVKQASSNFHILAPVEDFKLRKMVNVKPRPLWSDDPLLMYRTGDGLWTLVHKWGGEFSMWRAIKSFRLSSTNNMFWFLLLCWFCPLFIAIHLILDTYSCTPALPLVLAAVPSFIIALFRTQWLEEERKMRFTEHNWKSEEFHTWVSAD